MKFKEKLLRDEVYLDWKKLWEIYEKFFKYLDENFETRLFFLKSSKDLLNLPDKILLEDGFLINFSYFKSKPIEVDARLKGVNGEIARTKVIVGYRLSNDYNLKKRNRAIRANLIHGLDALFLRKLGREFRMIAVHDAFFIEVEHTSFLIDRSNALIKSRNLLFDVESNTVKWCNYLAQEPFLSSHSIFILI